MLKWSNVISQKYFKIIKTYQRTIKSPFFARSCRSANLQKLGAMYCNIGLHMCWSPFKIWISGCTFKLKYTFDLFFVKISWIRLKIRITTFIKNIFYLFKFFELFVSKHFAHFLSTHIIIFRKDIRTSWSLVLISGQCYN